MVRVGTYVQTAALPLSHPSSTLLAPSSTLPTPHPHSHKKAPQWGAGGPTEASRSKCCLIPRLATPEHSPPIPVKILEYVKKKKNRDTKGTFHAKRGSIKDRNGMDLMEADDIKKRQQEYTELYKKDLNDPDNHDDLITHLEPDILQCEVNWALGSIAMNKISKGGGIPAELFEILKDDAVKMPHSICQEIWKTQKWPQDWKRPVFIPILKKGNAKECSNCHTAALISHASKVMLNIFQAKF